LTTHDAGGTHGTFSVGDQQHIGKRFDGLAIQQRNRLTRMRRPHADVAFQLCEIVRMHRLAQIEHHVLCHINNGADGSYACAP